MALFADNIVAKLDTLVADENRRTGDQLANFVLALATEGAVEKLLTTRVLSHISLSCVCAGGAASSGRGRSCISPAAQHFFVNKAILYRVFGTEKIIAIR